MHAVYTSNLAAPLRPLALALAWFADDDGRNIWPSVETLSCMLGHKERAVRDGLARLRELNVITAESHLTGGRRQSTLYRMNFEVLAALQPGSKPCTVVQGNPAKPCTTVQGFRA